MQLQDRHLNVGLATIFRRNVRVINIFLNAHRVEAL